MGGLIVHDVHERARRARKTRTTQQMLLQLTRSRMDKHVVRAHYRLQTYKLRKEIQTKLDIKQDLN
jgi:hypothetical protein